MIFDSTQMNNDHHLFRFPSIERVSPFALPFEDFNMGMFKLEFDANELYYFLMEEEPNILKFESHHETTGLNDDAISSRWDKYNLFTRYEGNPLIDNIRDQVLTSISRYARLTNNMSERVFIHCWYNAVRKGKFIAEHQHDFGTYSYLSGNIFVKGYDKQSETQYSICNRDEKLQVKNNSGDFTLFPAWVPHETNVYRGEQPRITIGLNIYPMRFYNDFKQNESEHNWLQHVYTS